MVGRDGSGGCCPIGGSGISIPGETCGIGGIIGSILREIELGGRFEAPGTTTGAEGSPAAAVVAGGGDGGIREFAKANISSSRIAESNVRILKPRPEDES